MTTFLAMLGFGLLFAAFGLVKHRPECSSNCGGCSQTCTFKEQDHAD